MTVKAESVQSVFFRLGRPPILEANVGHMPLVAVVTGNRFRNMLRRDQSKTLQVNDTELIG